MTSLVLLLIGCAGLYLGGEALIRGCAAVGARLSLPPLVIGLVLVAFGTSAPELAVSLDAALKGHGDMAAGNVVGSNIVNAVLALLVLGCVARLPGIHGLAGRDLPFLLILSAVCLVQLHDRHLGRVEGAVLLLATAAFLWLVFRTRSAGALGGDGEPTPHRVPLGRSSLMAVAGITLLVVGAEAMVQGGIGIASRLGVSEAVIALTVTAVGTGIPEIAATLVALLRAHPELALGNLIGSNVINIGVVLAMAALAAPMDAPELAMLPGLLMLLLTVTVWVGVALRGREPGWMEQQ